MLCRSVTRIEDASKTVRIDYETLVNAWVGEDGPLSADRRLQAHGLRPEDEHSPNMERALG
jgi:hypothetical protein